MRIVYVIPFAAALLAGGCAPKPAAPRAESAPTPITTGSPAAAPAPSAQAPTAAPEAAPARKETAAAAPTPAATGADPIVGDWRMDQDQFTLYMAIKPDGKTAIDLQKTRQSLDLLAKKLVEKAAPDPKVRAQTEMVVNASMDKQIRLLAEYHGKWQRQGDFYRMESYSSSIDKQPSVTYARVEGEKLVSTDSKGVPKAGEPPAFRVAD